MKRRWLYVVLVMSSLNLLVGVTGAGYRADHFLEGNAALGDEVVGDWLFSNSLTPLIPSTFSGSPATTTRISVASDGTQGNGWSTWPSISADGRYVAFDSEANNLVPGDANGVSDIFVHDRQTGQTSRVSVASDGIQGNGPSWFPSISADGRYVAFGSLASNLVPGDTNGTGDVFVHDRQTGQTSRVSVASDGTQANGGSIGPSISADGRYVAFNSWASNLVPGDTNGAVDLFVHDRQTGQTSRVSVASNGSQANQGSQRPSISADGRYVAFNSWASNLVPGDTNGAVDIFVHDRQTGHTARASVASDGTQGNGDSYAPSISADGRYVAFDSWASNLVSSDTNHTRDVFVHDRQTGQTTRVSVASDGTQGNGGSYWPSISADGRYVAFQSGANNLVPGDTNANFDVFVHDRETGQTTRVSVASDGTQGNSVSGSPFISANGRYVAFESGASNLVPGDTNGWQDVFVHDRGASIGQPANLDINYQSGAPGSFFTLNGANFPANEVASVRVNGWVLGSVPIDDSGEIRFLLSTANADEGLYFVTVSANLSATVSFVLNISEPVRPQEGEGPIIQLPAGIAFTEQVFLPVITR